MWVTKAKFEAMLREVGDVAASSLKIVGGLQAENARIKEENARLRSDQDWFKLRLSQVELERAMLMQDRLGVRIATPQFIPAVGNEDEALNRMPDLSSIGGDAKDEGGEAEHADGIDYSLMPGYEGKH